MSHNPSYVIPVAVGVAAGSVIAAATFNGLLAAVAGGVVFVATSVALGSLNANAHAVPIEEEGPRLSKKEKKLQAQKEKEKAAKGKKGKKQAVVASESEASESEEEAPKPVKKAKKAAAPVKAAPVPEPKGKKGKAAPVVEEPKKGKKAAKPAPVESDSEDDEPKAALTKSQQKKLKQKAASDKKAAEEQAAADALKKGKKPAAAAAKGKKAAPVEELSPLAQQRPSSLDNEGWTEVEAPKLAQQQKKATKQAALAAAAAEVALEVDEDQPNKPVSIEINIPAKHFPSIIGPGGATLKQLCAETGARIDMPKRESDSTTVTITGPAEAVVSARHALESLVNFGFSSLLNPGMISGDMHVEPKHFGLIIGPKGANLKAIQTRTDTRINLPEKNSDSERVAIIGMKDNVKRAKQAIKDLIADGFSELTHPGYVKLEIEFPKDKLALLIGPKGHTIKSIQGNTRTTIKTPEKNAVRSVVIVSGPPAGVTQAEKEISRLLEPVMHVVPDEDDVPEVGDWGSVETAQGEDALW